MTFWEMLRIALDDVIRTIRHRITWRRKRVVRYIPRHDGTGRAWPLEDSGRLEELIRMAHAPTLPRRTPAARYAPKHVTVAPVAADWMPPIGARRIAATLEDTGVWNRAELERMLEKVPA